MTGTNHDASRLAMWSWAVVALTPVVLAVVIWLGLSFGEGSEGAGTVAASVAVHLLALAAPTAAVILALAAVRAGAHSGRAVLIVSSILLVGMLVAVPTLVAEFGAGWAIALGVVAVVLGFAERRHRERALDRV